MSFPRARDLGQAALDPAAGSKSETGVLSSGGRQARFRPLVRSGEIPFLAQSVAMKPSESLLADRESLREVIARHGAIHRRLKMNAPCSRSPRRSTRTCSDCSMRILRHAERSDE